MSVGIGERLPDVRVAQVTARRFVSRSTAQVFGSGRVLIVGVPGAFTPVCTTRHLPPYVSRARELLDQGYDEVACIAPNSPWTVSAWAETLDPDLNLQFFADGNMAFGRALGLTTTLPDLFIGECYRRFVLECQDGIIEALTVENSELDVACTDVEAFIKPAQEIGWRRRPN